MDEQKEEALTERLNVLLEECAERTASRVKQAIKSGAIDISSYVIGGRDTIPRAIMVAALISEAGELTGTSKAIKKEADNLSLFI